MADLLVALPPTPWLANRSAGAHVTQVGSSVWDTRVGRETVQEFRVPEGLRVVAGPKRSKSSVQFKLADHIANARNTPIALTTDTMLVKSSFYNCIEHARGA